MIRNNTPVQKFKLPEGYIIRPFEKGDEEYWCRCCIDGQLGVSEISVTEFERFITPDQRVNVKNIYLLISEGAVVGTVTYQYGLASKEGYIHMVGITHTHRGKGLSKYLLLYAIEQILKDGNETVLLTTDDWRLSAIEAYLNCGFVPCITDESSAERWEKVARRLGMCLRNGERENTI
jgi:N-acetylglutamate synthase-like GNAT family acetyltransferase